MRDDRGVAVTAAQVDGLQSFGNCADLIELDEDGIGHALLNAALQPLDVGHEDVVADNLNAAAELVGENLPARPIVLGQAVLKRNDGILAGPVVVEGYHLLARKLALVALFEDVLAGFLVVELAGRRIERNRNLLAGRVAGCLDSFENHLDGLAVGLERGSKAALVAHRSVVALLLEHAPEGVEGLGRPAQRLGKTLGAYRHDHELLKVHVVISVGSAVKHVQHGRRQHRGVHAAQIAVERNLQRLRHGARGGHGDGENSVGAQLALVRRAIQRDHGLIDESLIGGVHALQLGRNNGFYVGHGLQNSLASVVALVTIAQLHSLMLAGGSARGHDSTAQSAAFQDYVRFHGGIAARVQNLAGADSNNLSHIGPHNAVL